MRRTGMASSAPHGNGNWISKPSDTSFLPIGRMVRNTTNPILDNTNNCVLTPRRARSPGFLPARHYRRLPSPLPIHPSAIGASIWYHSFDGSWWLGKIKQPSDAPGRYVVRFLDNPGPALIDLPESAYNTALHAPCGSWCLQTHGRTNPFQGVLHG